MHPLVFERIVALEEQAPDDAIVVHDNPLLVEMGGAAQCDVVLVVDVPVQVQLERLMNDREMPETDARARIAAQASREVRTDAADLLIDNTGPLDELATIVGGVWDELVSRAASGAGGTLRDSE